MSDPNDMSDWDVDRLIEHVKRELARSMLLPVALLGPLVERIHDPVFGTAVCDSWIEDHDRGDEDPSEKPLWTVRLQVLEPIRVNAPIHSVMISGTVSV